MFDMYEEQSGGQSEGRVARKEAGEEARILVSHDKDFQFYSKYVRASNELKEQTDEYKSKWSTREKENAWFLTGKMSSRCLLWTPYLGLKLTEKNPYAP